MTNLLEEFNKRRSFIRNMNYGESRARLIGFLDWLEANEETAKILVQLENSERAEELLKKAGWHNPPAASSLEEIVCVGLYFLREVKTEKKDLWGISNHYGIVPPYSTNKVQDRVNEVMERYIDPTIDQIESELEKIIYPPSVREHYLPITLSGDFRGAILNINSALKESSQIVENISNGDEVTKKELVELLEQLEKVLLQVPADREEDAKTVAWAADELIKARTSERPNTSRIEITKDALKKAAVNIASVMPTVLIISEKIIEAIGRVK